MAYDDQVAMRVRTLLKGQQALVEKKIFGGLAYIPQERWLPAA